MAIPDTNVNGKGVCGKIPLEISVVLSVRHSRHFEFRFERNFRRPGFAFVSTAGSLRHDFRLMSFSSSTSGKNKTTTSA